MCSLPLLCYFGSYDTSVILWLLLEINATILRNVFQKEIKYRKKARKRKCGCVPALIMLWPFIWMSVVEYNLFTSMLWNFRFLCCVHVIWKSSANVWFYLLFFWNEMYRFIVLQGIMILKFSVDCWDWGPLCLILILTLAFLMEFHQSIWDNFFWKS